MANTEHLEELQKRVDKIDRCSKSYIDLQISNIKSSLTSSMSSPSLVKDLILKDSSMISLKKDIDILKRTTHCKEEGIVSLRDVSIDVKDTMEQLSINVSNMSDPTLCDLNHCIDQEKDISLTMQLRVPLSSFASSSLL